MSYAGSKREQAVMDMNRKLTALAMHFTGDCPECRSSFFACDTHCALVAAINAASDALVSVHDEVHKLEVSK